MICKVLFSISYTAHTSVVGEVGTAGIQAYDEKNKGDATVNTKDKPSCRSKILETGFQTTL